MPDRPQQLWWTGTDIEGITSRPRVAIVGSRKATRYGRTVTQDIASTLAARGVVIISGLAFGIDSYAHSAALRASGCTVAVLPSPLDKIYPAAHHSLAARILKNDGALVSEYASGTDIYSSSFIARNRIVSALADVLLITEAAKASGTMHTARFALEQGKTVMAVPGNITSPASEGCNNLIKSGAVPATGADDVFFALGIKAPAASPVKVSADDPGQQLVLDLISQGIEGQEELALAAKLPGQQVSTTLTSLELQGYIRPTGGGNWTVA